MRPGEWHAWFSVQAGWTRQTRLWLYKQVKLAQAKTILEVGCGTGAITGELAQSPARIVGLDIDPAMLDFAHRRKGDIAFTQGDAHSLPFADGSFDAVVCHYLLLWLADPALGVREMARVARPGGCVLACAEPDYGGRIDHPPELVHVGQLQAEALRQQGANPETGRRLGELFAAAGLRATVGTMGGQWEVPSRASAAPDAGFETEWAMRERDLAGLIAPEELEQLRIIDRRALAEGRRTLYVPTFYALGVKRSQAG